MTIREFRLPDPGEGLVEADIVTWRVAVGDQVKINDIVVEIETSKSLVELPSPYAGMVTGLLVAEGSTVDVGSPIIAIDDGVGAAPAAATEDMVPALPEPDAGGRGRQFGRPGGRAGRLRAQDHRAKRRPRKAAPADPASEQAHAMLASTFATDRAGVPPDRRARTAAPRSRRRDRFVAPRRRCRVPVPPPRSRRSPARPCWPSRRSASWPRIWGSSSPRCRAAAPAG